MSLIFTKSKNGRRGSTIPKCDVPKCSAIPDKMRRSTSAELPEVSELDAVRHFSLLSLKNIGVDTNFYPLGSCTMKYNPKFHEQVAALPGFSALHPLLPQLRNGGALTQGALEVLYESEQILNDLLGFSRTTMQPLAGAHGELTGVMLIAAYHKDRQDNERKIMLIPDAAHGTNPASAAIAGFKPREVATNAEGDVDIENLKQQLGPEVAGIMLTCPNTLGLFDRNVAEICELVHQAGGLCYCDGANLNAIIGRIRPGDLGFDVMHVNLHKTFATPHGGGGPGSGPVGVAECLVPYLPISEVVKRDTEPILWIILFRNPSAISPRSMATLRLFSVLMPICCLRAETALNGLAKTRYSVPTIFASNSLRSLIRFMIVTACMNAFLREPDRVQKELIPWTWQKR